MSQKSFFKPSIISLAVASALVGSMHAGAQESSVIEEVEVVGKGFVKSLMDAAELKRNSTSVMEAISAEDIGKLPDVSIAESLSRLPGLAVQRLNGRGQVVNLRGMSPDFSTGLLNGREQVSVGDNRGVEFDQYPAELLNQVLVYKTSDAGIVGQGLSGTVDLRTVRPLDVGERKINLSGSLESHEYDLVDTQDNKGSRLNASYIDQFADDTIGLVLGYSKTSSPNYGKSNNAWGYYVGDGQGNVAVGGGRVWARSADLDRDSFLVGLDLEPNEKLKVHFDGFYTTFEESQSKTGLVFGFGGDLTATSAKDGVVTSGSYSSADVGIENNLFFRDATMRSLGTNIGYQIDDSWSLDFDISTSNVERSDTAEFESNAALLDSNGSKLNDTVSFITGPSGNKFSFANDYSALDYSSGAPSIYATSPFGWGDPSALAPYAPAGQFGYNKVFDVEDQIDAIRLGLKKN